MPRTVRCVDLIFIIVAKNSIEERYSESELHNALSLYIIILHKCRNLVDIYLTMMNNIVLAKLKHHFTAAIPLTRIAIL